MPPQGGPEAHHPVGDLRRRAKARAAEHPCDAEVVGPGHAAQLDEALLGRGVGQPSVDQRGAQAMALPGVLDQHRYPGRAGAVRVEVGHADRAAPVRRHGEHRLTGVGGRADQRLQLAGASRGWGQEAGPAGAR